MYRLARNPSRRIYSCRNYSSDGVCQKCTFVYLTAVKSRIGPKIQQQLSASVEKYHQLQKELSSGNVTVAQMKELGKANAQLEPLALASEAYFEAQKVRHSEQVINAQAYEEAKQMVSQETDPDMKEMAEEEVTALVDKLEGLEEEIITLLLPQDEDDKGSAVIELRPGPGGLEASLWARDMYNIYENYANSQGWDFTPLNLSLTEMDGIREAVCSISGDSVFSKMKYESGVHRVQRVPATESSGRLHTSTMTVAVLAQPDEANEQIDIPAKDLRIDTFRAGGAGGQHVNTTDSAIRITHIPTGISVSVQNERSQHARSALKIIHAKIYEHSKLNLNSGRDDDRRAQIGTGDRSERIRTYNFPQDRITDHRIGQSFHGIEGLLENGELLGDIHQALTEQSKQKALEDLFKE